MLDDRSRSDTIPAMDVRAKRVNIGHEASIGKEEALNGQDHDHGKKTGLRSQQGGEHHAAAHMS